MQFFRYAYTHPGGTGTVVASTAAGARGKVWYQWTHGLPFQGFGRGEIKVKRGVEVFLKLARS